jgi:hypothetical protein
MISSPSPFVRRVLIWLEKGYPASMVKRIQPGLVPFLVIAESALGISPTRPYAKRNLI